MELVLAAGHECGASDVHLQPTAEGLEVRMRIDGVLQPVGVVSGPLAANVVARLKVLSELLTYRTDVPQEGRIRGGGEVEMRVSTFPTLHGEKAVVRLFGGSGHYRYLADLGLPDDVRAASRAAAGRDLRRDPCDRAGRQRQDDHGLRLPARAGRRGPGRGAWSRWKTPSRCRGGVAQSQVNPQAGLTWPSGLRSLMRQDPR